MADTSFTAQVTTVLAAWLNVINNLVYKGRSPNYVTSTGSANAQIITLPSGTLYSAYVAGDEFTFKAGVANTAAMTLQVIGSATLAATAVKRLDGSALIEGDLPLGAIVTIAHDGTNFLLKNVYVNVSAFGKTLIDDAAASDARTTLGLGTAATVADNTLIHLAGAETITGNKTLSAAAINEAAEVSIASAATVNIGAAASNNVLITGTVTITAFDTVAAGITRKGRFDSALTFTHNATSLILPGAANITTAANHTFEAMSLGGGNWIVTKYQKADGTAVAGGTAPVFGRVVRTAGDITTTSTSLVDVTGATVTFTIGAFPCNVGAAGTVFNDTGAQSVELNIAVDGALELGTEGVRRYTSAAGYRLGLGIAHQTAVLTAGSHTIKMQWKVSANTGTLVAGTAYAFSFWANEIR